MTTLYQYKVGNPGPQGIKGLTGDIGPTGNQGIKGLTGDQGPVGAAVQGAQGIKGLLGDQGTFGSAGDKGLTGSTGDKGSRGPVGDAGVKGLKGITGNTGLKGVQGIAGLQGDQGVKGDKGIKGKTGNKGDPGTTYTVAIDPQQLYIEQIYTGGLMAASLGSASVTTTGGSVKSYEWRCEFEFQDQPEDPEQDPLLVRTWNVNVYDATTPTATFEPSVEPYPTEAEIVRSAQYRMYCKVTFQDGFIKEDNALLYATMYRYPGNNN